MFFQNRSPAGQCKALYSRVPLLNLDDLTVCRII
jgi:hypothetical protein